MILLYGMSGYLNNKSGWTSLVLLYYAQYFVFQNKNSDFCAPLTSFDWNEVDPNLLGTSSIDTTCTIWGLEVRYVMFLFTRMLGYCSVLKVDGQSGLVENNLRWSR